MKKKRKMFKEENLKGRHTHTHTHTNKKNYSPPSGSGGGSSSENAKHGPLFTLHEPLPWRPFIKYSSGRTAGILYRSLRSLSIVGLITSRVSLEAAVEGLGRDEWLVRFYSDVVIDRRPQQ